MISLKSFLQAAGSLLRTLSLTAIVSLLCACFAADSAAGAPPSGSLGISGNAPSGVGRIDVPLLFEKNLGQFKPEARYAARGKGYNLFFTPSGALLEFNGGATDTGCEKQRAYPNRSPSSHSPKSQTDCSVHSQREIGFQLSGENREVVPVAKNSLLSYSNYLVGDDSAKWQKRVPHFGEVWYPAVYPGIDLAYYGTGTELEYDFVVAPGARADRIRFSITGLDNGQDLQEQANGDLVISTGEQKIWMHKPLVLEGDGCRHAQQFSDRADAGMCRQLDGGRFRVQRNVGAETTIGFELPEYDHKQTLVIDPVVGFSTLFGGNLGAGADGIQVDSAGDIYILGDTNSTNLPVTAGAFQTRLAGGSSDAFIAKFSGNGQHLIYVTYLGGTDAEFPHGIAVDSAGNAYVTGQTYSKDFPTVNAFQSKNHGAGVAFVSKLNPEGTALLYSTYLGGSLTASAQAIALDRNDQVVVTGWTYADDFPTVNPIQAAHAVDKGNTDAFLTKFNSAGTALVFSTYLGGNEGDLGSGVAIDPPGDIYITGTTTSLDFPTTEGAFQTKYVSNPWGSSFIAKFNSTGTELSYSTYLRGCQTAGIAVSASGNAFVTGFAPNSGFPTTAGAFQKKISEDVFNTHAFVTELNETGSSLVYSTYLAGLSDDFATAIAVDEEGHAYVTGGTNSQDFPMQAPVQASSYPSVPAAFVSEFNPSGSKLVFSTYLAGGEEGYGDQQGTGIAIDKEGNFYVAGETTTPGFPVVNALQSNLSGSGDAFIVQFLHKLAPAISLSPSSLSFSSVVGQLSLAKRITLANTGNAALRVSSIALPDGFSATSTCNRPVAPGGICLIEVEFRPDVVGSNGGELNITSNATIVPESVLLSGQGQAFDLLGSPGTVTVTAGKSAVYKLEVDPEGGFNQKVSFLCKGAPAGATCTASPSSVTPDGTNPAATSITVTTTGASASSGGKTATETPSGGYTITVFGVTSSGYRLGAEFGLIVQ